MKKILSLIIIALLLALSAQILIADEKENEIRRLGRYVNTGESDELVKFLLKAKEDGLPIDGMLNKVKEGSAKQVESEKILSVLYAKKSLLERARMLIKENEKEGLRVWENDREESIEKLAQSLEDGVGAHELKEFIKKIIENNEDIRYLVQSSSAYAAMLRAKLERSEVKKLITMAIEKRINALMFLIN
ncbi:hypothetical protein HY745_00795 [Candidatus Desantisbacteria bacterium]|nr:hypothetical protein [Candidatus Desantisbacteria bacterium]